MKSYIVWYGSWSYHTKAQDSTKAKRNAANAYKLKKHSRQTIAELMSKMEADRY